MIIIGEKINGTRKKVKDAIDSRDAEFIKDLALRQVKAGVDFLDVNAGTAPEREPDDMVWLVNTVQEATDTPLCLDSANPEALKAGIDAAYKKPMINSLSGEKLRVDGVLPLACENGAELIILTCDDEGIPATVEKRMEILERLISMTRKGGLSDSKLHIDPLVGTVSTDIKSGLLAFDAMKNILEKYPDVHITGGLSNISFGMPARSVINQAFAVLAIAAGMDSAIVDPENVDLRSIIYASDVVLGRDRFCMNFTKAFREGIIPGKKN